MTKQSLSVQSHCGHTWTISEKCLQMKITFQMMRYGILVLVQYHTVSYTEILCQQRTREVDKECERKVTIL